MRRKKNGLYDLIRRYGYTPKSLSVALGVSRGVISHWGNGRRKPSVEHIIAIAGALRCDAGEVVACFE